MGSRILAQTRIAAVLARRFQSLTGTRRTAAILVLGLISWGLIVTTSMASAAEIVTVTIDTSAWQGSDAELAFDLVGEGAPSNIVDITSFLTDGTLGIQTPTGIEV